MFYLLIPLQLTGSNPLFCTQTHKSALTSVPSLNMNVMSSRLYTRTTSISLLKTSRSNSVCACSLCKRSEIILRRATLSAPVLCASSKSSRSANKPSSTSITLRLSMLYSSVSISRRARCLFRSIICACRRDMPPFFGPIVMLVNSIYSSASLSAS